MEEGWLDLDLSWDSPRKKRQQSAEVRERMPRHYQRPFRQEPQTVICVGGSRRSRKFKGYKSKRTSRLTRKDYEAFGKASISAGKATVSAAKAGYSKLKAFYAEKRGGRPRKLYD